MKALMYLELALGRPLSLMLQLIPGDGIRTEGWVYISSVFLNFSFDNMQMFIYLKVLFILKGFNTAIQLKNRGIILYMSKISEVSFFHLTSCRIYQGKEQKLLRELI